MTKTTSKPSARTALVDAICELPVRPAHFPARLTSVMRGWSIQFIRGGDGARDKLHRQLQLLALSAMGSQYLPLDGVYEILQDYKMQKRWVWGLPKPASPPAPPPAPPAPPQDAVDARIKALEAEIVALRTRYMQLGIMAPPEDLYLDAVLPLFTPWRTGPYAVMRVFAAAQDAARMVFDYRNVAGGTTFIVRPGAGGEWPIPKEKP